MAAGMATPVSGGNREGAVSAPAAVPSPAAIGTDLDDTVITTKVKAAP